MTSVSLPSHTSSFQWHAAPARILIADDDPLIRQLLELTLTAEGYEVLLASDGVALVQLSQEYVPDLLLIDLMMPHLDGFEAIRQLRSDTRTGHLPMVIITARSRTDDLVEGLKAGADDFIVKPFDVAELLARIQANLSRAARQPVHNSLTGLPGNLLLVNTIMYHIRREMPFALVYADLDNFKIFNDTYGFTRGDTAICMLASLLQEVREAQGSSNSFIGHIGGDDFAIVTSPERAEAICQGAIALFDERVKLLYEPEDLARGYISGLDRHGVLRRFPLMSLSIGIVSSLQRTFTNHEEISQAAAEMKHVAKLRLGSNYAMDMRSGRTSQIIHERRGVPTQEILLVSNDTTLIHVLRELLTDQGYRMLEATSALLANTVIARASKSLLIIADAHLGHELHELSQSRTVSQLLLIIADPSEALPEREHAFDGCLREPFTVEELLACIEHMLAETLSLPSHMPSS